MLSLTLNIFPVQLHCLFANLGDFNAWLVVSYIVVTDKNLIYAYFLYRYMDLESKSRSQELVLNLIETVQQDFIENYGKYYNHPKKPVIIPLRKREYWYLFRIF